MHLDHTTELHNWVQLIRHGEEKSGIKLEEDVESYTVFMLMRHIHDVHIFDKAIAELYLESMQETNTVKKLHLEKTGDRALVIASLFPEQVKRARVSPDYFVTMSQMSYLALRNVCEAMRKNSEAKTYEKLSRQAPYISRVLQNTRNNVYVM